MACSLSANRDIICQTKTIPTLTIKNVLNMTNNNHNNDKKCCQWLVPVFQRRYCWGIDQLSRLLADLVKLCSSSSVTATTHSLGRIVVHYEQYGNVLLIDGQQRLTTVTILLSSIRDFIKQVTLLNSDAIDMPTKNLLQHLEEKCHHLIYLSDQGVNTLEPSYYDRQSYAMCINNDLRDEEDFNNAITEAQEVIVKGESETQQILDHILPNRAYFDNVLADGSLCNAVARKLRRNHPAGNTLGLKCSVHDLPVLATVCQCIVNTLINSFSVLLFETQDQDICSVYERLAMREVALSKQASNSSPGVSLAEADLARNFVTSFGSSDDAQIRIYQKFWAPLEQQAMRLCSAACDNENIVGASNYAKKTNGPPKKSEMKKQKRNMTDHINGCLEAFIEFKCWHSDTAPSGGSRKDLTLPKKLEQSQWMDPGETLFPMYSNLKKCIRGVLQSNDLPITMHTPTIEAEKIVCQLLTDLLEFATVNYSWE